MPSWTRAIPVALFSYETMDEPDCWAEDRRAALKVELEELNLHIRETRKAVRLAPNRPDKRAIIPSVVM
jgi:hypothetical protein